MPTILIQFALLTLHLEVSWVYMGDNKFIHASTSQGVITSSLNNVYWKKKYWQARRILD
ncbi:NlpC/P60 family protein [Psychromonas hadalis]|uniref:NlpC/P60 family protein n=1 Tax=Psychromonas hadalis TaxID=211669 RepID=UPI000A02648C